MPYVNDSNDYRLGIHTKMESAKSFKDLSNIMLTDIIPKQPDVLYHYQRIYSPGYLQRFLYSISNKKYYQHHHRYSIRFSVNRYPIRFRKKYGDNHFQLHLADPREFNDPYDTAPQIYGSVPYVQNYLLNVKYDAIWNFFSNYGDPSQLCKQLIFDETQFTDLYDGLRSLWRAAYSVVEPGILGELKAKKFADDIIQKIDIAYSIEYEKVQKEIKIYCFSSTHNSMLMWSHYADNHRGICLEYNISSLKNNSYLRTRLFPVIYLKKTLDMTIRLESADPEIRAVALVHTAMMKAVSWAYEKEWRLILSSHEISKNKTIFSIRPSKIFIGCRMNKKDRDKIVKYAKQSDIQVIQMKTLRNKYDVHDGDILTK